MLHRLKQLYSAITAEVRSEEDDFLCKYLTESERELFYRMSVVDQRHALDVSYLVLAGLSKRKDNEHAEALLKAALLHDVGKRDGDLTLLDRFLIVILGKLWPTSMDRWAREGRGGFITNRRHAFYVARHHGHRGAEYLLTIGVDSSVVELVRNHHEIGVKDWRMKLLQSADSKS